MLDHQERALAEAEPYDALRREAEALGVRLSLPSPLPVPGERYHADWVDRTDDQPHRHPALDTDVRRHGDPVELIARCLEAVNSQGGEIVVLGQDLATVATIARA